MQTNACANKLKKETKKYLTLLFDTITFKCNERKDLFHLCQYLSFSIIVCIALHITLLLKQMKLQRCEHSCAIKHYLAITIL